MIQVRLVNYQASEQSQNASQVRAFFDQPFKFADRVAPPKPREAVTRRIGVNDIFVGRGE